MTEQELEQIYTEAYKPVYWTAMQLLKNEADAEDALLAQPFSTVFSKHRSKNTEKVTTTG